MSVLPASAGLVSYGLARNPLFHYSPNISARRRRHSSMVSFLMALSFG